MIRDIWKKYKMIVLYGIFGVLTTIVNLSAYYMCTRILLFPVMAGSLTAWFVGVVFAYITNRVYVFESKKTGRNEVIKEIVSFVTCRILSEGLELAILFVFVASLHCDDLVWKVVSNIVVIVFNYVASKIVVFRKK